MNLKKVSLALLSKVLILLLASCDWLGSSSHQGSARGPAGNNSQRPGIPQEGVNAASLFDVTIDGNLWLYWYDSKSKEPQRVAEIGENSQLKGIHSFGQDIIVLVNQFDSKLQNSQAKIYEINSKNGEIDDITSSFDLPSGHSYFEENIFYQNKIYTGFFSKSNGVELYQLDLSEKKFEMVQDLERGPGSSFPATFTVFTDQVYFSARTGSEGIEWYRIKNNSIEMVSGNRSGGLGQTPRSILATEKQLFFTQDNGSLKTISASGIDSSSSSLSNLPISKLEPDGNRGFFYPCRRTQICRFQAGDDSIYKNLDSAGLRYPRQLIWHEDVLYFIADTNTKKGVVAVVKDSKIEILDVGTLAFGLQKTGIGVIGNAYRQGKGHELFFTDGSDIELHDLSEGPGSSYPISAFTRY